MKKSISYLNRKYPFDVLDLKSMLLFGLSVSALIYIFKPFGFINYTGNKEVAAIGFGLTTIICLVFGNYFLKKRLFGLWDQKWSIVKEFGYTIIILLTVSMANLLYFVFFYDDFKSLKMDNLSMWIKTSFLICRWTIPLGMIPMSLVILLRYNKMLRNDLSAIIRGNEKKKDIELNKQLIFTSQNVTDKSLVIPMEDFLFMEAVKNNVFIYYLDDGKVITKSVRNTLTNLIDNLKEDALFRCHRSFMVNLNKIKNTHGNSNGYKIVLHGYNTELPVSRNFAAEFQKIIY